MAENDFLRQGDTVSGTDITINQAPSQGTEFLSSFLGGMMKGGGQEEKLKKEKDKLSYYTELREAGYSAEEATARVNKQFSGGFLNKILKKDSAGFSKPENDTFVSKTSKDKAAAAKDTAVAGWYNRRSGESGTKTGTGDAQRMVSLENMLTGIKRQLGNLDPKKDAEKIKKLDNKSGLYERQLEKLTGVSQDEEATQSYVPGETKVGQTFQHSNGKTYKVLNVDDPNDPDVEEV